MKTNNTSRGRQLETIYVTVEESLIPLFEQAFEQVCETIGFFEANKEGTLWRIEGVKEAGAGNSQLQLALSIARASCGQDVPLHRHVVPAQGWLERNKIDFPPIKIGKRFLICPTHTKHPPKTHRIRLTLDAGIAFGSGEHATTRGCIKALEMLAPLKPRHILDVGTGSGILAMAAASLLHKKILATDIDPWAVKAAKANIRRNHLTKSIKVIEGKGWDNPLIAKRGPYDLVFENILARPLCLMASHLARHLYYGGHAILSGLLVRQIPMVMNAHLRQGLALRHVLRDGEWATLIIQKPISF